MSDKQRGIFALFSLRLPLNPRLGHTGIPTAFLHHLSNAIQRKVFYMKGKGAFLVFLSVYVYVYLLGKTGRYWTFKQGNCMVEML